MNRYFSRHYSISNNTHKFEDLDEADLLKNTHTSKINKHTTLQTRCDMLCTSGFMDDVTFGRSESYGDAWLAVLWYRAESDVYEYLVLFCF